ncbi:MAG: site-specific integrase [bacterium]|nr:site-specific integrase [bacterium]
MTMLATGARPAELIPSERSQHTALLKSEVDAESGIITIRGAKLKPGQEEVIRKVKITESLMEDFVVYARTIRGPHVFPSRNESLKRTFERILKRAAIDKVDLLGKKLTAHSFRHTYCTLVAEALGYNPFVVKATLGHSQISTTSRYYHAAAPVMAIDLSDYMGNEAGEYGQALWTKEAAGGSAAS